MKNKKPKSTGNQKTKEICIRYYTYEGKKYIEVFVQKRDKKGQMKSRRSRFTESGTRISSLVVAEKIKASLRRQLEIELDRVTIHSWESWFNEAIMQMRAEGLRESTISNYKKNLEKWLDPSWGQRDLGSFTRDDVYHLLYESLPKKDASSSIRNNVHKGVHKIFEMALNQGEIIRNPAKGLRVKVTQDEGLALTSDEVEILLSKGRDINHEYYPHWVLALMTGMRNGELYALRWSDIDFTSGVIQVSRQFTSKDGVHLPKRGRKRTIDLSSELDSFLHQIKLKYGLAKQKMWSWSGNCNSNYGAARKKEYFVWDDLILPRMRSWKQGMQAAELKNFCRQIGIKEIKFHDLRATHITSLLSNGVAISKVMRQAGHSRMTTTDGYHRLAGVEVKGITQKLGYHVPTKTEEAKDCTDNVIQLFPNKST